eukprot:356953-Rhodomonas_salina.3
MQVSTQRPARKRDTTGNSRQRAIIGKHSTCSERFNTDATAMTSREPDPADRKVKQNDPHMH